MLQPGQHCPDDDREDHHDDDQSDEEVAVGNSFRLPNRTADHAGELVADCDGEEEAAHHYSAKSGGREFGHERESDRAQAQLSNGDPEVGMDQPPR